MDNLPLNLKLIFLVLFLSGVALGGASVRLKRVLYPRIAIISSATFFGTTA